MRKNFCKTLSLVLTTALVIGSAVSGTADAKKAVKLSKTKLTIKVGEKKTIKVKNSKKKAKWTIKSGKKCISLSKKKKSSVVVKGKKAGTATVQAKVAGKNLKCKVVVQEKSTDKANNTPTPAPTDSGVKGTPTPAPTSTASPTPAPTEEPPSNKVKNIVIDLTDYETTFEASPAKIEFRDQLESRFDLSYFDELQVSYELEFEDDDSSDWNIGKIGIAQEEEDFNGFADGVAFTYGISPSSDMATVDISEISGPVIGINVQPMNGDYAWPDKLIRITITKIEFIAKEGAEYPDPTA